MSKCNFIELTKECSSPQTIRLGLFDTTPMSLCIPNGFISLTKQLFTPELNMGILLNQRHVLQSYNTTHSGFTFTGYPNIASTGVTVHDLATEDPNFPVDEEPNWALVLIVQGVASNVDTSVADTTGAIVISTPDGGDLSGTFTWFLNQKIHAGQIDSTENHLALWVPLNDQNQIAVGVNTSEESGTNSFAQVYVAGYVTSTDMGILA